MSRRVNGQGSEPFQRPGRKGWYSQVRVTDPLTGATRRQLVSAPTKTKLAEKVRQVQAGQVVATGRGTLTVRDYAATWSTGHLAARDVTPGTRRLYRHALNAYVVPVIGDLRLDRVRISDAEKVDAALQAAGKATSTRRVTHTVLQLLLATAVRDGVAKVNPAAGLPRPTERPKPQPRYSADQVRALLCAVDGERILEHLVPLMLWTGLRPGEALALRWSDLDLAGGVATVAGTLAVDEQGRVYRQEFPKGKVEHPVPLVAPALEVLKRARVAQAADRLAAGEAWAETDLVFTDPIGRLVDDRGLRRRYRPIVAAAGLTGSFHSLRRSTATLLTGAGVPLPVVSQILGHTTTRVTAERYAVADVDMMRAALAALAGQW